MNNITAKSIIVTLLVAERTRIQNSGPLYSTKRVCEDLILTKAFKVPTQLQQQHALNSLPRPFERAHCSDLLQATAHLVALEKLEDNFAT